MSNDHQPLFPQSTSPHVKETINLSTATAPLMATTGLVPTKSVSDNGPMLLGPSNTITTCPFCAASVKTAVRYTATTRTHMTAVLCCFVMCCWCMPYCMNSTRNADHYCPNCKKYLGTYKK